MGKLENFIHTIKNKKFVKTLIDNGLEVFVVGGVVRDLILNRTNKDIDLVVRGASVDDLIKLLSPLGGSIDVVGKSFGVIKFVDLDGLDYDIALPRKEVVNGEGGYKGFDVQSDENMEIEYDLSRRDATINAMAININTGEFIDPLNGLEDIKNKRMSAANPNTFKDDPLRMLRMVSFASRFGFSIESETMNMIKENSSRITEIPSERILIEFNKIVDKADCRVAAQLLKDTYLFKYIFNSEIKQSIIDRSPFEDVSTVAEFIFLLIRNVSNPSEFYLKRFSTEASKKDRIGKEIKAFEFAFDYRITDIYIARSMAFNMYATSPNTLSSKILPDLIEKACNDLLSGRYPKTYNDLALSGNDFINLGLKGKEIGEAQKRLLLNIYSDKVNNSREDLIKTITGDVNEGVGDVYAEKKFGIPNQNVEFDKEYQKMKQFHKVEDIVCKIRLKNGGTIPIIKNPKSLHYFDDDVRAIGLSNGDIYVALYDGLFTHGRMGVHCRLIANEMDVYDNLREFITLNRVDNTNKFGLSDSSASYIFDIENKADEEKLEYGYDILMRLKTKNPSYDFYLDYFGSIHDESIPVHKIFTNEEDVSKTKKISYSGVVLDVDSRDKLIHLFKPIIPKNFEIIAHHMTINLGNIRPDLVDDIGKEVKLKIVDYAYDDKVIAVGVDGYPSNKSKPHITIAVNRINGGSPKNSDSLTNWKPINKDIFLTGIVTEVEFASQIISESVDVEDNESKYNKTKKSILLSRSLSNEMKDKIIKYLSSGSKYSSPGVVVGLSKPNDLNDRLSGVSMGADKDGFFVYTHRARSKSYPTPEKITLKDIKFIESTG